MGDQPREPFVVRVAGLPVAALTRMRFTDTSALVERLSEANQWLAEQAGSLGAELYQAIGQTDDPRLKPRLVGLRRAVHGLRPPARSEWNEVVQAALPTATNERLVDWLAALTQWRHDNARLPALLRDEADQIRQELRAVAADAGFRRALWQSSRSLSEELDKWLADPGRPIGRQRLFRLAKYVARAAAKTSPYATFAVSGLGRWSPAGPAIRLASSWEVDCVTELHGGVSDALAAAVTSRPDLRGSVLLRANPSLTRSGQELSYLGPRPSESIVKVPLTPALRRCLDLLGSGAMTARSLRDRLAAGADPVPVARFIGRLVDSGLLHPYPAADRLDLAGLQALLSTGQDSVAESAGELVDQLDRALREPVPVAELAAHRERQGRLGQLVGSLGEQLARPALARAGGAPVASDAAVTTATLATCAQPAWQPALADLREICRWLGVFDSTLPLKLVLADFWSAQFSPGARMPFVAFHRAVQAAAQAQSADSDLRRLLWGPFFVPGQLRASSCARVRQLSELQQQARRPFRAAGEVGGAVQVAAGSLASAELPDWVSPLESAACYVQPLPAGPALSLVLNLVDGGYGRGRTRVAHLRTQVGGGAPAAPAATRNGPGGAVLAELGGAFGSTLNHRTPGTRYEIDYPFAAGTGGGSERLPLADLMVERDPDRDLLRLYSGRLDREVRPLDLGMLSRWLLPPAARLLVQAFGLTGMLWPGRLVAPPADRPTTGVRRLPRVAAGRVVLRRAQWVADPAMVPRCARGESDSDYLLRLTSWRRAQGIPRRCYVRMPQPLQLGVPEAADISKARKPVYLDFDNWFLVQAFENMLRASPYVVTFDEALPDPEHVAGPTGAGRVTELIVDVTPGEAPDGT